MPTDLPPGWTRRRIGDIAKVIGGGTPSTKVAEYWDGGVPWITPKDLSGYRDRYIAIGGRSITEAGVSGSGAKRIPAGSVMVSSRAPIGYVAIASAPVTTNQGFRSLVLHSGHVPEFYYYVLKANTALLESRANGSTFKELSGSSLADIELVIPPLDEQRRIVGVLGALDDKIEANRRMNASLDALARAGFREQFGRYGPGDALPAGWRWGSLDSIADYLNGVACQKYPAVAGAPSLPVIKIRELRGGINETTDRATPDIPAKYHVRDGDVLFSWSGTLEARVWSGGPGALNQHLFKVTSASYPDWFFFYWILHHLDGFRGIAADKATTMGHIKRHHLTDARVVVPSADGMAQAGAILEPLFRRQHLNDLQGASLAALRDRLLPKLLSGELRVSEAEETIDATT